MLADHRRASPNHEARSDSKQPSLLILHYTGMTSGPKAVEWLCSPVSKVSCHYLVDVDGSITQMVDEDRRAWHAGVSSWHADIDVNSSSIGIEIQNDGHSGGLPNFPDLQMQRVASLSLDIMQRHSIPPHCVLAHSDIAPGRKIDPGEAFDWLLLAKQGVGQVVNAPQSTETLSQIAAKQALRQIGYGLDDTPERLRVVLEAFQRRYRRTCVDGKLDAETSSLIVRLAACLPIHKLNLA
jgi:N-acetylmuramoyl-L-alanine amidase